MAFVEERDEYCEEEEEQGEKKLMGGSGEMNATTRHTPFSFYPSATSSSSTTSTHYHQILPQLGGRWGGSAYDEPRHADQGEAAGARAPVVEREHMFDKVVTPSDVGKLNRLVIPKQHAEKYFPLDSSANEKGLLLNFEDRTGKPWRFRYSYWNSSQSYVMTKGWSRFVKDKKLDAGDIVSFERGVGEASRDRLFIDWKRRPDVDPSRGLPLPVHHRSVPWGRLFFPHMPRYNHVHVQQQLNYGYGMVGPGSLYSLRPPGVPLSGSGEGSFPSVFESVPVAQGQAAAAKRLRLFGVNLDCPDHETDGQHPVMAPTGLLHTMAASSLVPLPQPQLPPPLQLQLYHGGQAPSSSTGEVPRKQKTSSSLDLDI